MTASPKFKLALVGTDSLRAKEIKRALEAQDFPLAGIDFFDPDIEEEYSKLTDFGEEPKVIRRLSGDSLEGRDLVFLAADPKTNRDCGRLAERLNFKAVDLSETFNDRADVPLVVAGINEDELDRGEPRLAANPHPAAIFLSLLFKPLLDGPGLRKAISFILRPASALDVSGIEELAGQSVSLLGGTALTTKVFGQQMAFNLLPIADLPTQAGIGRTERQIRDEVRRVLGRPDLPLSLSVIQASQFHTYAMMTYLELEREADLAAVESALAKGAHLKREAEAGPGRSVSCISVTGRDEVVIGPIQKEESFPGGFWVWAIADNLTRGSALNAVAIARKLLGARRMS